MDGGAVPCIEVTGFSVDHESTCRYHTSVTVAGRGEWTFSVRWSQMETLVRDLRAAFPAMPETLNLPKYYFKTVDDGKLDARRQQLAEFWDGFLGWLSEHDAGIAGALMDTTAMQRVLREVEHNFAPSTLELRGGRVGGLLQQGSSSPPPAAAAAAAAAIAAPAVGERPAHSGHRGGGGSRGAVAAPRVSLGSERCIFSSRSGETVGKADFELIASLGEGSFGRVMLCRRTGRGPDGGALFAMKALDKERVLGDESLEVWKAGPAYPVLSLLTFVPSVSWQLVVFQMRFKNFAVVVFCRRTPSARRKSWR
eukprot:COSAG06_NODE_245_length_19176_cov_167.625151_8_plen_310_part_00